MPIITRETIYKRTKTGAVQIWYGELDGEGRYRTVSGQETGKKTVSEWTLCEPKNVGRSNATTIIEQAALELDAIYNKKLDREYRRTLDKIDVLLYTKPAKGLKWYDDAKKRPKPGTVVAAQPKLDGMRCLTDKDAALSGDGIDIPGAPHIIEALEKSGVFVDFPALKFDGELYNHLYKTDFEGLMSALKKAPETAEQRAHVEAVVQYHIYDLVLPVPYRDRLEFIEELFVEYLDQFGSMFQRVPTEFLTLDADYQVVEDYNNKNLDLEYEGSYIHLLDDKPYEPGSRNNGFKVKKFIDGEFPIKKILEGKGNWAGHAKAILIQLPNGNECKASVKGDKAYAKALLEEKDKYEGKAYATVSYLRYTKYGMLNLPIFKTVRWDI
jgi:DNA ligase-1